MASDTERRGSAGRHFAHGAVSSSTVGKNRRHGAASQGRIAYIDTIKGFLILCVAFGHVALPIYRETASVLCIYRTIYLFHMPLFVFVSGFLSKGIVRSGRLRAEKALSTLMLAMLFKLAIQLLEGGITREFLAHKLLYFSGAPWYLISLATWYCMLPFFRDIRASCAISLSVIFALLAGTCTQIGQGLSLSRTFVYFPYFLIGYYCDTDLLLSVKDNRTLTAVVSIASIALIAYLVSSHYAVLDKSFYLAYGDRPYHDGSLQGSMERLMYYGLGTLLSLLFLVLAPNSRMRMLSYLGERTLQVYVVHRLLRSLLSQVGFYDLAVLSDELLAPLVLVGATIAIVAVSLMPVFGKLLRALMGMRWSWVVSATTGE